MNRLSEPDTSLTPAYQNNYMQRGVTRSAKTGKRKRVERGFVLSIVQWQRGLGDAVLWWLGRSDLGIWPRAEMGRAQGVAEVPKAIQRDERSTHESRSEPVLHGGIVNAQERPKKPKAICGWSACIVENKGVHFILFIFFLSHLCKDNSSAPKWPAPYFKQARRWFW